MSGRSGWRTRGAASSDWDHFRALAVRAATEAEDQPRSAAGHYEAALALVRDKPFAGIKTGYGWADAEGLITAMETHIETAAVAAARLRLRHGEPDAAVLTLGRVLRHLPQSRRLQEQLLATAAAAGPDELERAWRRVQAADDDQDLRRLHQELTDSRPWLRNGRSRAQGRDLSLDG
ncbi:MAG TPA: bacterial transcriptional activator domain-containing protein [Acidimicrobiales bacterium]|nr:bacterial transcriptional activator domain-containing protein [Acidimicrobiales bacterium]